MICTHTRIRNRKCDTEETQKIFYEDVTGFVNCFTDSLNEFSGFHHEWRANDPRHKSGFSKLFGLVLPFIQPSNNTLGQNRTEFHRNMQFYANGYGVKQDRFEAAKWFHLTADQGDIDARIALVQMSKKSGTNTRH